MLDFHQLFSQSFNLPLSSQCMLPKQTKYEITENRIEGREVREGGRGGGEGGGEGRREEGREVRQASKQKGM